MPKHKKRKNEDPIYILLQPPTKIATGHPGEGLEGEATRTEGEAYRPRCRVAKVLTHVTNNIYRREGQYVTLRPEAEAAGWRIVKRYSRRPTQAEVDDDRASVQGLPPEPVRQAPVPQASEPDEDLIEDLSDDDTEDLGDEEEPFEDD